jgi:hypothetical protein
VLVSMVLVVTRSRGSVPTSHHSWLEVGSGVLVAGVVGVCCEP